MRYWKLAIEAVSLADIKVCSNCIVKIEIFPYSIFSVKWIFFSWVALIPEINNYTGTPGKIISFNSRFIKIILVRIDCSIKSYPGQFFGLYVAIEINLWTLIFCFNCFYLRQKVADVGVEIQKYPVVPFFGFCPAITYPNMMIKVIVVGKISKIGVGVFGVS